MKKSIILYFILLFCACKDCKIATTKMKFNVPKSKIFCNCSKISTEDTIRYKLGIGDNTVFYFCPILVNYSKSATLYQYWTMNSHMTTDMYFIITNGNLKKINTNVSINELGNLLEKSNFKNYQIKRLLRQIQRLREVNKKNSSVF